MYAFNQIYISFLAQYLVNYPCNNLKVGQNKQYWVREHLWYFEKPSYMYASLGNINISKYSNLYVKDT